MAWVYWVLVLTLLSCHDESDATCSMTDDTCEFWLVIDHYLTMMDLSKAVYPANGKLYYYDVANTSSAQPVDVNKVISADGWEVQRMVIAANRSMPGPPIEVYENQTVVVHVKNIMTSAATTIHWHGLHQHGTPWMDGVAFITQCPILPGQSFTYKFKAYPTGTFWYHSHIGSQLSMGLTGAFVIREKVPQATEEFIMMVQDWNHHLDSDLMHQRMVYGFYENRAKLSSTGSLDGSHFSMFPFHSGLINGKGRFYYPDGSHNQAPLTTYTVKASKSYRFRVINSGNLYPFSISIDSHNLTIVASDGFSVQPVVVESFIINPGERYDFELQADQPVGNYWIHGQTLEVNVTNHIAEAVLRYEGAPEEEPKTSRRTCTTDDRCLVLNCPFSYYPNDTYKDCVNVGQLRAAKKDTTPGANRDQPEKIEDIFLNFAFPGTTWTPGSTNGHVFQKPPVVALTQSLDISTSCKPSECGEDKLCTCTFAVTLELNKVYQLVLLNLGRGKGWAHPIHMHGHSFHVVKMGYPQYNQITGKFIDDNPDINCRGNSNKSHSFCNNATWINSSWGGNNVPGLELDLPPRKDTIIVPSGGYAVIRIRADNPGVWLMHCHVELHNVDGMAMVLNESYSNHKPPPPGFPRCGSFNYDQAALQGDTEKVTNGDDGYSKTVFWTVVGILLTLVLILCFVIAILCCRQFLPCERANLSSTTAYHNSVESNNSLAFYQR